LNDGNTVVIR